MDKMTTAMQQQYSPHSAVSRSAADALGRTASFLLATMATLSITMSAAFYDSFSSVRMGATLLVILLLHIQFCSRILICREFVLYICFVAYMILSLLWTEDDFLALNTLVPAANFVVILILFGSLVTFHDLEAVLAGFFGGLLAGAVVYTGIAGFPFVYPIGFSYNSMANLYLFGLFVTLLYSCFRRSKILLMTIALVFLSLILATTSIKTNLGILLGAATAGIVYFGYFKSVMARYMVALVLLISLLGFGVASNDALMASLQRGMDRVSLGVKILQVRESVPGYGGFESRSNWLREGIVGWSENPVFGHGVEAFRSHFGMTSHWTPIDLLYNSGLIGFGLFYLMFLSMAWRLVVARNESVVPVNALILGVLVCYLFITMSGTMHYNSFLAAFIAISVGLLRRYGRRDTPVEFVRVGKQ